MLEALQRWRKGPGQTNFELQLHGDLGREMASAVAVASGGSAAINVAEFAQSQKEAFIDPQATREQFMRPVVEFLWTLIRAGVLQPSGWFFGGGTSIMSVTLTDYGLKFLDNLDDHPLSPTFVDRLRARHPSLPEAILALMVDVRDCLDAGLLRPAVVLLGVAVETAVEKVLDDLEVKGVKAAAGFKKLEAGARIDQLRKTLDVFEMKADEKRAVEVAITYVNALRDRRNDASHTTPKFPFDDLEEVEELVVSGGRNLPALWSLTTAKIR